MLEMRLYRRRCGPTRRTSSWPPEPSEDLVRKPIIAMQFAVVLINTTYGKPIIITVEGLLTPGQL